MFSRITWLLVLVLLSFSAISLLAATPNFQLSDGPVTPVPSSPILISRTEADTLLLMGPWGSGAPFNGQFQNQAGQPQWNSWTHEDLTVPEGGSQGVGDFSQLRTNLMDLDDCRVNSSSQVCFIDDGVVVPGTGGTPCIDWCYGPGGFVLNCSGGLTQAMGILNAVTSPVIPWPENHDGGMLDFDVFVHQPLTFEFAMHFYLWRVRSVNNPDPEALLHAPWVSNELHYYGGPKYLRHSEDLMGMIEPGATFVQVQIVVVDPTPNGHFGWLSNGTPAPYFDNVRISAVDTYGPEFVVLQGNLANDSFPEAGKLYPENLAANNVRFDSGFSSGGLARDAIGTTIAARGEGTHLGVQALHYRLIPNAVFDPVRTSGWPNSGSVPGTNNGNDSYYFDLPDTGFFYPGDVIHYYFTASQETPNGLETVMVPADTSGFSQNPRGSNSQSPGICAYDELFSVRAMPSMIDGGDHPHILIWDDSGDSRFTASLRHDVNQAQAFTAHSGFDLYRRLAPRYESNFAREATAEILAGYQAVFYFSSKNKRAILGGGSDASQADLDLLTQWLEENPNRGLFLTGDHVLGELDSTPAGAHILNDYLGATLVDEDLFSLIQGPVNPTVLKLDGVPYLPSNIDQWYVPGYCPDSRAINAVQPLEGAVRLAEFATPGGQGGAYPYAAMLANEGPNQSLCFSMPFDLRRIQNLSGWEGGGVSLRSSILASVASLFSGIGFPVVDMTPVPDRLVLSASAYPNPFNPSTTISFNLPHSGHLNLKIFNIRGELVRTLVDEFHEAGPGRIVWSGDEKSGGKAASGVYFYELRFGDEALMEKMMLVK